VAALCVVILLAGCDSPVRLMPTLVSFRSGDVDPFEKAGYKVQRTDLPVFYVTHRGAVIDKPEPIHTLLPGERLRMGVARMRIGDDTPDWMTLHRLSTSDDPAERPIVHLEGLEQVAALGAGEPWRDRPTPRPSSPASTGRWRPARSANGWSTCTAPTTRWRGPRRRPPSCAISPAGAS
jgi:hypothetical protein